MDTEGEKPFVAGEPARSKLRIFFISLVALLAVIAAAAVAARSIQTFQQNALREKITLDLMQKAQAFAARLNSDRTTKVTDLASRVALEDGARATVVDGNGDVLADSQVAVAMLEKEGEEPEFAAALRGRTGVQVRKRGTLGVRVLYVAVPVSGGAVRLSTSLSEVETAAARGRRVLWRSCAIAAFVALTLSALIARVVARP